MLELVTIEYFIPEKGFTFRELIQVEYTIQGDYSWFVFGGNYKFNRDEDCVTTVVKGVSLC